MSAAAVSEPPDPPETERRRFPVLSECTAPPGDAPCANTRCRYHLAHRAHWDHRVEATRDCAIAVANEGPHTQEQVAAVLGMTTERVRQLEASALEKLRARADLRRYYDESE